MKKYLQHDYKNLVEKEANKCTSFKKESEDVKRIRVLNLSAQGTPTPLQSGWLGLGTDFYYYGRYIVHSQT